MNARRIARWVRRGVVAALAVGALAACSPGEDTSQLPLLLDDPMAATDLLGLTLVAQTQEGYRTPLGKPSFTTVTRTFAADDDDALAEAILAATEADWEAVDTDAMWWAGAKAAPARELLITFDPEQDQLHVTLKVVETP